MEGVRRFFRSRATTRSRESQGSSVSKLRRKKRKTSKDAILIYNYNYTHLMLAVGALILSGRCICKWGEGLEVGILGEKAPNQRKAKETP